jgi:curved DNA-binding protein CbpA
MPAPYDPRVDYYAILSVEATATTADIKKAHRTRISELHPDRGGDSTRASAVNVARDVLSEPNTRREYDQARRDWILKSLQSPLMRALFDPDGRLSASLGAQVSTHGSVGDAPHDAATTASSAHTTSAPPAAAQAPPPDPRRSPIAGVSRFANQRVRPPSQPPIAGSRSDADAASSQPDSDCAGQQWWKWGLVSDYTWGDVQKTFASGDWLGAVGMLGTARFLDRALHETADPARRAEADAELAARQRERAMTFLERVAGALDAHFGLNIAEAVSRASAEGRKAASPTAHKASSPIAPKAASTTPPKATSTTARKATSSTPRKTASTTARQAAPDRAVTRRGKRVLLAVPPRVVSR